MSGVRKTESVEEIIKDESAQSNQGIPLEIWHQTSIHVSEEHPEHSDPNNGAPAAALGHR
jgi:hypothetical protein